MSSPGTPASTNHPSGRLQAALGRVAAAIAAREGPGPVLAATAEKAEEFAELLEASPHGSRLWGYVSGGGPGVRAVFVIGLIQPAALELAAQERSWAEGQVVFGPEHEGPPGFVHGGIIAGAFDDACAAAQAALAGPNVLTRRLTVTYRRPTPIGRPLKLRAEVTGGADHAVQVEAVLRDDDEVYARATAEFVQADP